MQDLEKYSEHSVTSLLYLTLQTLDIHNLNCDHAASHLVCSSHSLCRHRIGHVSYVQGKAMGIVTSIRAIPYLAQKGKVWFHWLI